MGAVPDLELTREVLSRAGVADDEIDPRSLLVVAETLDRIYRSVARRIIVRLLTDDTELARKIRNECLVPHQN